MVQTHIPRVLEQKSMGLLYDVFGSIHGYVRALQNSFHVLLLIQCVICL